MLCASALRKQSYSKANGVILLDMPLFLFSGETLASSFTNGIVVHYYLHFVHASGSRSLVVSPLGRLSQVLCLRPIASPVKAIDRQVFFVLLSLGVQVGTWRRSTKLLSHRKPLLTV